MKAGFAGFLSGSRSRFRPASQVLSQREDDGSVRIPNIQNGALFVVGGSRFLQLVAGRDGTVFGFSSLGAPTAVPQAMLDCPVKGRSVSASLSTRYNLRCRLLTRLS